MPQIVKLIDALELLKQVASLKILILNCGHPAFYDEALKRLEEIECLVAEAKHPEVT
jgi:hypothetical protein